MHIRYTDDFMESISFRAEKELKKQIDDLAQLEKKNKSDEYREIFLLGIGEKRKELASLKYQSGEFSLGQAAELANITIWEFLHLLKQKELSINLTKDEVLKGLGFYENRSRFCLLNFYSKNSGIKKT